MNRHAFSGVVLALFCLAAAPVVFAQDKPCFESRKGASELTPHKIQGGLPSVKCSPKTGAVLWWGDPFDGTVPMGERPTPEDSGGKAVVRPREDKLSLMAACGVACHNGSFPPPPKDKNPRALAMHQDIVPDALNLQHGRGAIWCLDCHAPVQRNKLIDNFGNPTISFNEPQKLCGKCHGPILRDWRDGIHGKRIGEWASNGKKRWFVCTECHNPHDVQQGARNSGFAQLEPEQAPVLPKGLMSADHERDEDYGATPSGAAPLLERLKRWLQRMTITGRPDPVHTPVFQR